MAATGHSRRGHPARLVRAVTIRGPL